jgi:hypothetical protein
VSRLMMNPAQGSQLQRVSDDLYALPYFFAREGRRAS